ncbi:MAG TPA: NAD-dependent epimerase/dehydratase family protein [Ilumatobacteraceae bacterium]
MSHHVVFGTGQIGTHVAGQLIESGADVVVVSRSGRAVPTGARALNGDLTDAEFAATAAKGAAVIYFCLNAPSYRSWPEQFPPLQRAAMHAAFVTGARLVVLENLYSYGPTGGRTLTEDLPAHATSAKARTRIEMTDELLEAHHRGTLDVTIGRASDFFGPRVTQSALGDQVIRPALTGERAQVMGDPGKRHSYSYAPDVATGLIALGTAQAASGEIWHLPIAETLTTREFIDAIYTAAGHPTRLTAAGRTALAVVGLVKPELKELRHTLYQFTEDWVVDDTKFRTTFGDLSTPLTTAIESTVHWYRTATTRESS